MESLPTEILDHILKQIKCESCQKYCDQIKLNYLYQECSKTCSRWNNILENMFKQLPFLPPWPDNMIRIAGTLFTIKQLTELEKEFHINISKNIYMYNISCCELVIHITVGCLFHFFKYLLTYLQFSTYLLPIRPIF